ncbi:ADP ribosyltransferase [Fadolivirus algeromassiliense]|uniref:ADP ribosyltransferase n=1 Tax=Fadolivirus FV1/VV64 TaxID=3070911 RepID=A0A7D3V639_9VIRU|nr:ADP ribosyltransferase [Fadolivirus algeromassiliense]QKF94852.1 ADP ribosyltransferase [Fadolivirus FV1/VV64]
MNIQDSYIQYKIFNSCRYMLYQYIKESLSGYTYYLHGGNILLFHINQNILDKLMTTIIDNDTLPDNDKKFFMELLYSDDIDIVTNTEQSARSICNKLHQNLKSNTYVKLFMYYIKYIMCYYHDLNINDYGMDFIINETFVQSHSLFRIMMILIPVKGGASIGFNIVDILYDNFIPLKSSENMYDMLTYEFTSIVSQFKKDKIASKHMKRFNRLYFFMNMFYNGYVDLLNTEYKNNFATPTFSDTLKNILDYLTETIKLGALSYTNNGIKYNEAIKYMTIKRLGMETFNLLQNEGNDIMILFKDSLDIFCKKLIDDIDGINLNNQLITKKLEINTTLRENILRVHYNYNILSPKKTLIDSLRLYKNELQSQDTKGNIRSFTSYHYTRLCDYIYDTIYGFSTVKDVKNEQDNENINSVIHNLSRLYNDSLFTDDNEGKYLYVYRGENYIMTNISGAYDNLKKGDLFVIPTIYSTTCTLDKAFTKPILLRIRLDRYSKFLIICSYSSVPYEHEIMLPYGSMLKVVDVKKIDYKGKRLLVDLQYIDCIYTKSLSEFISYYRNYYLDSDKNLIVAMRSNPGSLIPGYPGKYVQTGKVGYPQAIVQPGKVGYPQAIVQTWKSWLSTSNCSTWKSWLSTSNCSTWKSWLSTNSNNYWCYFNEM